MNLEVSLKYNEVYISKDTDSLISVFYYVSFANHKRLNTGY